MCNFGVRIRFRDVIYGVRPPNGSPASQDEINGIFMAKFEFSFYYVKS